MSVLLEQLDREAEHALARFCEDISLVGRWTGRYGLSVVLSQRAQECATVAFFACGDSRDRAWSDLVQAVDELLAHCSRFGQNADAPSFRRLRLFVYENSDALAPELAS